MPRPVDSAGCSAWPICSLWHFAHRSSVHALLHKAAAWELRRRPCVSVRLRPALPCNPNFYIDGLSINYWGYIVRQLPCVTNGSVDGKCFLLCVWQTAGGLLGAACWLYAQLLFSLWPRWELKPSARPSVQAFLSNSDAFCKPRMLRTLCRGLWNLVKVLQDHCDRTISYVRTCSTISFFFSPFFFILDILSLFIWCK